MRWILLMLVVLVMVPSTPAAAQGLVCQQIGFMMYCNAVDGRNYGMICQRVGHSVFCNEYGAAQSFRKRRRR